MSMPLPYVSTWLIYGLIVVASGVYRYVSRPDGDEALYFGLVMGALAIGAALLVRSGRSRAGHVAGFVSVAFVAGWFLFESLIEHGGNHEPRLLLVATLSLVQAGVAVAHLRRRRES